ncbi:MAG: CIA30 family protein [Myxococcota bacterium]|nr:CIA30 family protein [Myxococcota bacterium]
MPAAAALFAATAAAAVLSPSLRWDVVNDSVMGGVSTGRAVALDDGGVRFTGDLSLDNNGGFASIRSAGARLPVQDGAGLRVTVLGDGRVWQVTLRRDDVRLRAGSYRAAIRTTEGAVTTHDLAWADFQATSFGRPVPEAPALATGLDQLGSIGLLLADKTPGPFAVELRAVEVLGADPTAAVDAGAREGVMSTFSAAIRLGVPAFNGGQPAVCAAHYQTALESALLLGTAGLRPREVQALQMALAEARMQEPAEAAWTFRRAMDTVLAR